MPSLRPRIRRLFRLDTLRPDDAARDVDDEMRLHLDLRAGQLVREGLEPAAAAAEARRLFAQGGASVGALYSTAGERNQRMRITEWWESLGQDLRYVCRRLGRGPLVTTLLVLTLALGIGANVTAFSLVDRILLRGPEHVRNPSTLARLYIRTERPTVGVQTSAWLPYSTYTGLRTVMRGVEAVSAYRVDDRMVGAGLAARKMRVGRSDGDFFTMLGVQPVRGRFLASGEDAATAGPLAVLGEAFWRTDFASDPQAIGRTVVINDLVYTIVGVAPAGFTGPALGRVDVWTNLDSRDAKFNNWNVVVRTSRGGSVAAVSAEAESAHQRTINDGPEWSRDATLLATPIGYDDNARESMESVMARWLAMVSAIILLITCANVVNVQLARLARRRQEMGIRVALGAGRGRIVRLLVFEGAVICLASGVASLLVAGVTEPLVRRSLFEQAGWTFSLGDSRALLAVAGITLLTALVVGIVPALQLGAGSLTGALSSGTRVAGVGSRARQSLTILQTALSVILLVGAGLFLRSLGRMHDIDLGLNPDQVLVADPTFPKVGATKAEQINYLASPAHNTFERQHFSRLRDAMARVPGVERAALTIDLPFNGSVMVKLWGPAGDSIPENNSNGPFITAVDASYFATVGTRLIRGRTFTSQDGEGTPPVAIVGAAMAKLLWPHGDAVGSCLTIFDRAAPCARVVGVVADIHRTGFREESSLQYYVPIGQEHGFSGISLLIRSAKDRSLSWPAVRRAMLDADPSITAIDLQMLSSALDQEIRPRRLGMVTFALSGALALLVAALGLYSLMSYTVAWRTHEIGVRMAIGATGGDIARVVVGGGIGLAAIGVAIGLALALLARRWIQPQLFETSAADPLVLGGVAASLLVVALAAAWVPAHRASRINPTEALRAE